MSDSLAREAQHASSPPVSLWQAIREAVRGNHDHDYTEGVIGRSVILLAIPMVLEMAMESVFAVVDVFFVSRLGAEAVATVVLTESLLTMVYTLAMGLGIGATAMVARRVGERDAEGAASAAMQAIWLGVITAVALGLLGAVFAPQLLALMGADEAVLRTGTMFTRVMLGGNLSVLLLFLVNAIFRGAGDAAIAMRSLWLANAINMTLGPCLIFGVGPFPELGVTGAAVGTTIGRLIGAFYAFRRLLIPGSRLRLERRHLPLHPDVMWRLVKLSASGTFQIFIGTASWVLLIRIVSSFGSNVLAGYGIAIRMIIFALLPSWGMSNAAATMVGQALGAGKPERAEAAVWIAGKYNAVFLGTLGLVFVVGAPLLVRIFTTDAAIAVSAIDALRVIASGFLFYAYGMVITQALNGAGDTWTPTWINLACFWCWELPLGWFLGTRTALGAHGVYLAIAIAYASLAVVSVIVFRRGTWKLRKV